MALNVNFPTMGGEIWWDVLDCRAGYTLQQHKLDKHCRILDCDDIRIANGTEGEMRARFKILTGRTAAQYGDVIGVHRIGGVYDHYGVYERDDCVYEFAGQGADFGQADIHTTTLTDFIADSGDYFVLEFPKYYGTPAKVEFPVSIASSLIPSIHLRTWLEIARTTNYHLYSPEETIERAKSKLGQAKYNLVINNCEHYAIWCKTGLHQSHQVEKVLSILLAKRIL